MPRYEYECVHGHDIELQRKVEDRDEPVVCPICGEPMRREMSLPARPVVK